MDKDEIEIARYQAAADNEKYEADMVWQTFSAFLLAQTIFLAFLLQSAFGKKFELEPNFGACVAAFFGLLICVPWMVSFYRSMAFFNLRNEQAKLAEPESWKLLNGDSVEKKHYKIPKWVPEIVIKKLTTRSSVALLIWFFIGTYILIICLSSPLIQFLTNFFMNIR